MDEQINIVKAEAVHYNEILRIYNEGFLPKFRFISGRDDLSTSFADDFGLIDLESDDKEFVAVLGEKVLGILSLRSYGNRKDFEKTNLSYWKLIKKYGVIGVLKAVILGIAFSYKPPEGELYIDSLGVSADARGQGVGSLLLTYAEELARTKGFSTISLNVMFENLRAKALYERHGFRVKKTANLRWFKKTSGYSGSYFMVRNM